MKDIITAIDLGTHQIVCLSGEQTEKGIRLLACKQAPSRGITRGEVWNNQLALQVLRPLIRDLENEMGQPIGDVVVSLSGTFVRCTTECNTVIRQHDDLEISQVEIAQLQQAMQKARINAGETVLHAIPQSYHIDEHMGITEPVGMFGKRIEANYKVVVGRAACVESSRRCLNGAGLPQARLVLSPLATAYGALKDDEKELGVALVDIGAGTTGVVVCYDNVVRHCAIIPFGGNTVTEDIRQGCAVTSADAERLKIQYGYSFVDLAPETPYVALPGIGGQESREISLKTLSCIIEARMDEIMDAVLYEIDRSGFRHKLKSGIVLTGGGAQLLHLQNFVKYKTGYETRVARPCRLDPETEAEWRHVTHSCAAGLLQYGFDNLQEHQELLRAESQAAKAAEAEARKTTPPEAVDLRKRRKKGFDFSGMMESFWGKPDKQANQA